MEKYSRKSVILIKDMHSEGWKSMDRYADNLYHALSGQSNPAEDYSFSLFTAEKSGFIRPFRPLLKLIPGAATYANDLYFSRFIKFPFLAQKFSRGSGLVHVLDHSYAHVLNWIKKPLKVVTCHDLHPLFFETDPRILKLFRKSLLGMFKADLAISDSRANRKDMVEKLGIPEDKIRVIPLGVDAGKFCRREDPVEIARLRKTLDLPEGKILLHVGNSLPYKNLEIVIKALGKLVKIRSERINFLKIGRFTGAQKALAAELGVEDRLAEITDPSDSDLAGLYSLADLLVQPSLKEGFGFTVLEALACGTPVLVSRGTSLTEIAGKVGSGVDGQDLDEVVQKIYELLFNYNFLIHPTREQMRHQAEKFTWKRTAEETLRVYSELLTIR
ncbi:MAG: glycosyltransferase family 1 protein [Patescibacteria group bacterium]